MRHRREFTEEEERFLAETLPTWSRAAAHIGFFRKFGWTPGVDRLRQYATKHGLRRIQGLARFSAEEREWLDRHCGRDTYKEIGRRFGQRFGWHPGKHLLGKYSRTHGFPPYHKPGPNAGSFKKGDPRAGWNCMTEAGKKAFLEAGKRTRFKKGERNQKELPVGTITIRKESSGRRIRVIKLPGRNPWTGLKSNWTTVARHRWEKAHGPIPDGHALVHLDGDSLHDELDNLALISRGALALLNAYHAPKFAGKDANPARVRLAQLRDAVAQRGKNDSLWQITCGRENPA